MPFYAEFADATRAARAELYDVPLVRRGVAGDVDRATYVAFLTEAWHHVRHTVPLMMACGARLPERLDWLRRAVTHYIDEETGHDEWILEDLRACGADPEAVRNGTPGHATDVMVAYAWDTVTRRNPVGLFGMVHVLEGTSVDLAVRAADALRRALGLPEAAFTYLHSHGVLDREHTGFLASLLDRLEDSGDRAAVLHCARAMYRLYGDLFRSLGTATPLPVLTTGGTSP